MIQADNGKNGEDPQRVPTDVGMGTPTDIHRGRADLAEYARDKRVVISVRDVSREYRVGGEIVRALRGVSVDIYAGEYVSIMGPSGSGKSTLFNQVGGLDRPTTGTVIVQGVDLSQLSRVQQARFRNRCIGYIFQTYNLIPVMTAEDNVALPLLLGGVEGSQARRRAREVLEAVGLGDRWHHRPDELSGGQQQRTAIARAFATDPAIILADEPTGNLDTRTGEAVIEMLSRLSRERGVTVITATHDHKMLSVSDRVISIRDGSVEKIELRSQLRIQVGSIDGKT